MINNFKKINGVAMLPLVLLVGGLITVIAITVTLTSSLSSHSSAAIKWSSEALAGAQAGVDDSIMKIIRDNNHSGTSTLTIGNANVTVTVSSTYPIAGKDTITSCGVVRSSQRKLQAVVNIDATTGQVNIESIQEIATGENCPSASVVLATVPSAPQSLSATRGNTQVVLNWSAPSSNGGSSITSYKVYRGTTSGGETLLISGGCSSLGFVITCTDTGLTNGTTYYYKVSAVNVTGEGTKSSEVSGVPSTVPSTPQSLAATPGNTQIVLNWSAPSSNGGFLITNYKVYRGTTSGGETLLTTLGNVLTYTNTSLTNGTTYYYKFSAVNSVGEGSQSNEASATPVAPSTVPSAPQSLTATPGNTQVVLNWSAPSSNGGSSITSYKVYRGTTSGGETLFTTLDNVLTYTNTGLTNGTTYYYKVSAVNTAGEGSQSNEASAKPVTVPTAPQSLTATAGNTQVILNWSAPSSNGGSSITNYKVYRGTSSGSETLLITLGNVLTYTNTSLTNGTTYYYKVSAVNTAGEGSQSSEASTTPFIPPSGTYLVSASTLTHKIYIHSGISGTIVSEFNAPGNNPAGLAIYNGNLISCDNLTNKIYIHDGISSTIISSFNAPADEIGDLVMVGSDLVSIDNALGDADKIYHHSGITSTILASFRTPGGDAFDGIAWDGTHLISGDYSTRKIYLHQGISSTISSYVSTTMYNQTQGFAFDGTNLLTGDSGTDRISVHSGFSDTIISSFAYTPGDPSAILVVDPTATVPSAPQSLTATPGNTQVVLNWSAPSSNGGSSITSYKVYRGTTSGGETLFTTLDNVLTYTNTGLTNGTTYYYKVSAVNLTGEGTLSSEVSATAAWALSQTTCDALSGWHWYATNARSACWSKTLADYVSWNKGVGNDTDVTGTYTCTSLGTYDLQTRMTAAAAGEWYKIVSVVNSVTITSSHNGSAGYSYISALAISDCTDGTKDLVDCGGACTDWSTTNTWLRTWAGAASKSALPYLSTDAGTTQATNDYWDACTQHSGQDTPLNSTNLFYVNHKVSGDTDTNYSWSAACGYSDGMFWDSIVRILGFNSCSYQDFNGTSGTIDSLSFRVVVRP